MGTLLVVLGDPNLLDPSEDTVIIPLAEAAAAGSAEVLAASSSSLEARAAAVDVVVVCGTVSATDLGQRIKNVATPVVVLGASSSATWSTGFGLASATTQTSRNDCNILAPGDPLVAGLTGSNPMWDAAVAQRQRYATVPVVGAVPLVGFGSGSNPSYFVVPAGTTLEGGGTGGKRYALTGHSAAITADSGAGIWRTLFSAAVADAMPTTTPEPVSPTVSINPPGPLFVGTPTVLDATISTNGGTSIASIAWTFPAGLNGSSATVEDPSVTATAPGSYPVSVTVTNTAGKSASSTVTLGASDVVVPASGRVRWNGTALVPVERVYYLGGAQWLNLTTGAVFASSGWVGEFA